MAQFRQLQLLTGKPVLYACNVDETAAATGNELSNRVLQRAAGEGAGAIVISAAIEAEVAGQSGQAAVAFDVDVGAPPPRWTEMALWIALPLVPIGLYVLCQRRQLFDRFTPV